MMKKQMFYHRYGVEEYYIYDPDRNDLSILMRGAEGSFEPVDDPHDWVSPRLGIRFQWDEETLTLLWPDGQPFSTLLEERQRAEQAEQQAAQERQRAEQAQQQAEQERERADRLAARLRELGLDPQTIDP
jgi:Uma2 family endonuclease